MLVGIEFVKSVLSDSVQFYYSKSIMIGQERTIVCIFWLSYYTNWNPAQAI